MTWSRNPFKIPQLFSKQGNSCEPPVSSLFYEMMRLEYQNHGRVGCLTVDTFGYPPSLHRQSHYIVLQSQHTPHSQQSDILIILPRSTPRGASCLQNIHSVNFLFSLSGREGGLSSQFKQNRQQNRSPGLSFMLLVSHGSISW